MLRRVLPTFFTLLCVLAFQVHAQQVGSPSQLVQRDPQALQVLTQAVIAAGGISAIAGVEDYTATGTITYSWGGHEVPGAVTLKGRGTGQFRLDVTFDSGVRSWAVNNGTGFVKETSGTVKPISYPNAVNFGSLTFPATYLLRVLQDASSTVLYVGLESKYEHQVHHIQTQKAFTGGPDPRGHFSRLSRRDFFIDTTTYQVLGTMDSIHPENAATIDLRHEMQFSEYQSVNGVLLPFSIAETISGQHTYTMQIAQVSFNSGLENSVFELQP